MHTSQLLPTAIMVAVLSSICTAQDGRVTVKGFTQKISASNGGIGGTSSCQIAGGIDRGNQPIGFAFGRSCDRFQDNSDDYVEFPENPDLKMRISCDVRAGHCGNFYE